jgi:hypothetical protein
LFFFNLLQAALSLPDLPLASATEQVPSLLPLKQLSPSTDSHLWPGKNETMPFRRFEGLFERSSGKAVFG